MKKVMIFGYRILGIIACLIALCLNLGIDKGQFMVSSLNYFTILSNIFALIYFILALTPIAKWQWLRGSAGMTVLLTMLVYNVVLVPYGFSMGDGTNFVPYTFKDIMVHIVVPCIMVLDMLLLAKKGGYRWHYPLTWSILPLAYVVYALVRGAITGNFPYFFMDYNTIGVAKVVYYCLAIAAIYIVLGYIVVLWNKFIGRDLRKLEKY